MTRFTPQSAAEAREWTRARIAAGQPFAVRGAATRAEPADGDTLATEALDHVLFFEPEDMVIGVEAGMRWADMRRLLAERGMALPVNSWRAGATVGGMLAANDFGPERLTGGGLRDCVIGMAYTDGLGRDVVAGGKVVKNVTGYDLCRMMIGSLGGLGVITAVNFKLAPAPESPHALLWRDETAAWAEGVARAHRAALPVEWLQAVRRDGVWTIGAGVAGNEARQARLVRALTEAMGGAPRRFAEDDLPEDARGFAAANRLDGFLEPFRAELADAALHLHLIYPTAAFLDRDRLAALAPEALAAVHPIGGDAHLIYPAGVDPERALADLRPLFADAPGFTTLARASGDFVRRHGWCLPRPAEYRLMQALKRKLDPKGVLIAPFYEMRP